jgi:DamX protein
MHRAIALLLTAVVAGVWLAWSSYQRLDAPAALVPMSIPHTGTLALPGEQAGEQPGEQESDAADAGGDKVAEQQIEDHEPTLAPPTASATPPSTPLDPPSPQAVDLAADTPDPMAAAPGAPAPVLAKRPEPVAKTAAKPSPAAATAVSAAPAPAATPAAPVKEGPHGAAWVLAQPEGNYTLQLFGTSNKARWQSFVQAQRPGAPVAGFVSRRDGAPWYVVIYGSYPTQAMAKADVTRLPASVGNVEPWLRTFRAIRATVVVEGSAAP